MQSYIVRTRVALTRQAGDTGSIVFIVPALLPLTGMGAIFRVMESADTVLFTKETPDDINITDQTITVILDGNETAGFEGIYDWELQVNDATQIITVGKGTLEIVSEIITDTIPTA